MNTELESELESLTSKNYHYWYWTGISDIQKLSLSYECSSFVSCSTINFSSSVIRFSRRTVTVNDLFVFGNVSTYGANECNLHVHEACY